MHTGRDGRISSYPLEDSQRDEVVEGKTLPRPTLTEGHHCLLYRMLSGNRNRRHQPDGQSIFPLINIRLGR
jgi:hypothetical protein